MTNRTFRAHRSSRGALTEDDVRQIVREEIGVVAVRPTTSPKLSSCSILDGELTVLGSINLDDVLWKLCGDRFENAALVKIEVMRAGRAVRIGLEVPWREEPILGPLDLNVGEVRLGQQIEFAPGSLKMRPW